MNDIFQIPAEIWKIETRRNGSVRLIFDSQENVSPEAMKRAFAWKDQVGWLMFAIRQIKVEDMSDIPEVNPIEADKKTPSQRLRAVLFRSWEKNNRGYDDFNLYYLFRMEKLITHVKQRELENDG